MKFQKVIRFLNILGTISLFFLVINILTPQKTLAQSEPVPGPGPAPVTQTPEQCMGEALANYMNAIIAAKYDTGQIPSNVKLLSPAFNMTSYTFPGIVEGMKQSGADFSRLDGISGNVYNVGGQSISYYMNNVRAAFPGAKFVITETGTFDHSPNGINQLAAEMEELRKAGDIDGALLFNGLGSNPGWNQHAFTEEEIKTICGGDCKGKKIGFNTANMFGFTSESYYQQASSKSMTHSLEIADSGQINNTLKGIQNSINNGMTPIIRIGVGTDSGGFDDPATYASFLEQVGKQFPGVDIYAIAGPNEPDLEPWLAPECAFLTIPGGALDQCVGPINVDLSSYRGQVIGHQDPSPDGRGPWTIYASATDDKENSGDLVSQVIVERMRITPTKFWHTDFSTMTQKYIGSLDPLNEDFINTKAESQFKVDTLVPRSLPIYLASHIPGYIHTGGFQIPAQKEKSGTSEPYNAFQARVYPSQDGKKPGTKSAIDGFRSTAFIGCLQSAVCNPAIETCLKNDKSGDYCSETDSPAGCIGVGELLKFQMTDAEIELIEPPELQAMDKVLWDFSAAVVRKPGDSVPSGRGIIMATSLEDYYAQEKELLAEVEKKKEELMGTTIPTNTPSTTQNVTSNLSTTLKNADPVNPKQAQAQTPPFGADQSAFCSGANILIENKKAENQFGVKVWNAQPDCPQVVDWAYYVEYWVGNDADGYEQVGTCGDPNGSNIHKSAGLPTWKPDTDSSASDSEKWGVSVGDLAGCSVPVTPRDLEGTGKELKVHFQISGGRVPNPETSGSNPSCTQYPMCTCPNEGACGITDNKPLPPIDCTKCETWAPSGECSTMVAEDLLEATQCAKGHCEINDGKFRLADKLDSPPTAKTQFSVGQLIGGISDYFAGLFRGAASKLYNLKCNENKEDDYIDVNGVYHSGKTSWDCTFGERQYLMYGYVPGRFKGKLNQFRTSKDFQVFQAMYKVPGVSEEYFRPQASKHELTLKLELNPDGGYIKGDKVPECTNSLADRLPALFGFGGDNTCLDLEINGGAERSMYIEYSDHYSQAAQYCLSEAAGSLPTEFPTRALDFCQPFMSSLRGGGFSTGSTPGGNSLSSGTIKQVEQNSLALGVPARLLTTILEIEGGNANSCFRPTNPGDTGTGPYQITDDLAFELTSDEEQTKWNIQRWPAGTAQSVYREDGRCDFNVATELTARALKSKAGLDPVTGTISESDFETVKKALNGYYGQYNSFCGATSDTENRWGTGISYCDYGLWRMGLTQYCTDGKLSPTCDNEASETTMKNNTETENEIIKNSLFKPVTLKADPEAIQAELASDIESLLEKYSQDNSFDLSTPIEQTPKGFQEELKNLEKYYREKYAQ